MDQLHTNSNAYWDNRFSQNWDMCSGPKQSRFFARITLGNIPSWFIEQIRHQYLTLVDWGCAQGDGTDVWRSHINSNLLFGVDFSLVAIERAQSRYPTIKFICENWLDSGTCIDTPFDILFSSNTLEHFHKPFEVLDTLSSRAKKAIVLALPYKELDRIDEHFFSFFPENIPMELSNGFRLIWSKSIDCSTLPDTLWNGNQIVLIYAEQLWISSLKLRLIDCELGQDPLTLTDTNPNQLTINSHSQISDLSHIISERDAQISNLNQVISERDLRINELNQTISEREAQIKNSDKTPTESYLNIKDNVFNIFLSEVTHFFNRLKKYSANFSRCLKYTKHHIHKVYVSFLQFIIHIKKKSCLVFAQNEPFKYTSLKTSGTQHNIFLEQMLIIITGLPFDDIGGGQRAAQLARCALKTGKKVIFIYIYKKFDFSLNKYVDSHIDNNQLEHYQIDDISCYEVLSKVSENTTLLIELPHPKAIRYLELFQARGIRVIFELIDDWESSLGGDWFDIVFYKQFVNQTNFVVGTSKFLTEKLKKLGRYDAIYIPNAANEYIFDKYKQYSRPHDLPVQGKIGIYFGSLYGEWFAWDYLFEAAKNNPEINFILIGDYQQKFGSEKYRNIYFLGEKKIEQLPAYLAHCSFALLPFRPGKIVEAVSPIKAFEYLFLQKPLISSYIPELVDYPGVFIAKSPKCFSDLCSSIESEAVNEQENDKFISENSWFSRLESIMGENTTFSNKVSAIVLIYNNKNIIDRYISSLLKHCNNYLKEIIVVDNASTDGGSDLIKEKYGNITKIIVLNNPVNGCSSGRNLGASIATGDYLAFFDSDQWFTCSSAFEEALTILKRNASIGAVSWAAGWIDKTNNQLGGDIVDYLPERGMNTEQALLEGFRTDVHYLGSGGLFLCKSLFEKVGGFDQNFDPTCFEDTDLSFKIRQAGFKICYRDLNGIRHQAHTTTNANNDCSNYKIIFQRNSSYFKEKWDAMI